jgi:hypothetical protein
MSNDPCPFCQSTNTKVIQEKEGRPTAAWIECQGCKARGPVTIVNEVGMSAQYAYILWGKRPAERYLKKSVGWLINVHAASASDYEAKSVSSSKRQRQMGILAKCLGISIGTEPDGIYCHNRSPEEQILDAGQRAARERERLSKVEAEIQAEKKARKSK